jgi:hypothetical protein
MRTTSGPWLLILALNARFLLAALMAVVWIPRGWADSTYVYAVQLSSHLQSVPAQITLSWEPDPYGASSYTIHRKAKEATDWGEPVAALPGSALSWTDADVTVGSSYEYRVVKIVQSSTLSYTGFGYIFSGIEVPPVESRGTVILIVAKESTIGLETELAQLQSDLIGDGWQILRHDVSTNDTPENVRTLILGDYWADTANVNTVFLLGHVPVLQSGYLDYDGHGPRPMPADAFYGDVYYDWPTDPATSPSYLPSDIPLMIGRVDFANMPGVGAPIPWPSETELLRNYLKKDHNWRHKRIPISRLGLMGNRRGDEGGLATAASGYRNFEALVGPGNTMEANIQDTALASERWSSMLAAGRYLWAYGCGAGLDDAISHLGTNGPYDEVLSTDIVGLDVHAVFVMVFGSHLGNWDHTDNIMRSVLATPSMGLACFMSGEPHWFCHHLGLGETIGYSTRLSLNNSTLYQNEVNPFTRAVYIALMGDPTLRMEPVAPPTWLTATAVQGGVGLSWGTPSDPVAGYAIYRATSPEGPFTRLNPSLVANSTFLDTSVSANTYTYMVRAVALTTSPSGSYFNPSQGVFATVTVSASPRPITVSATPSSKGLVLTWNSQPGLSYHVEGATSLFQPDWVTLSGSITASETITSWTDTNPWSPTGFYRVGTP